MSDNKIGIAILTYNRPQFCHDCINSIPKLGPLVVINDGNSYRDEVYDKSKVDEVIQHSQNKSVGVSKNEALRWLYQNNCEYLFLVEDDMFISNPNVFEDYIKASKHTGLTHLMFGYHGDGNINPDKSPKPRKIVDYGNGIEIALNLHCVGSFCMYHRGIVKHVGYIDEHFNKNCWDHVEHSYKIVQKGLIPAYWWWPDLANSYTYIKEQGDTKTTSVISHSDEWMRNMREGAEYFKHRFGYYPTTVPDTPEDIVYQRLKEIKKNYARI
jgi:glycosyltransferase involved in cell wall biosynthesis